MTLHWQTATTAPEDAAAWDAFLRQEPLGSYQQASGWAAFKASDAWRCHRLVARLDGRTVAGAQILWRRARFGRIGYISKGPVCGDSLPAHARAEVIRRTQAEIRSLRLTAIVAQAPDGGEAISDAMEHAGFFRANPLRIIESTYLVSTRDDLETIRKRMKRSVRQNVRNAAKTLTVRDGQEGDLPAFFRLMQTTCERQQARPNPSSAAQLVDLWRILHPQQAIHLFVVEAAGEPIAGLLCLLWGRTVAFWKKGWSGSHAEHHPNELLHDTALEWAHRQGFSDCDFCSLDPRTAERMLQGGPAITPEGRSRDTFNLRFGGYARLLPPALFWIPHPLLRCLARPILRRRYASR